MDIEKTLEEYLAARKTIAKILDNDGAEKLVAGVLKKFFKRFGDTVGAVQWTQYTPSFCDGDPCTFRVGDIHIIPVFENEEDFEPGDMLEDYEGCVSAYDDESLSYAKEEKEGDWITDELIEGWKEVLVILGDYEILEYAFGPYGACVTATKNGIESQEYDCGY